MNMQNTTVHGSDSIFNHIRQMTPTAQEPATITSGRVHHLWLNFIIAFDYIIFAFLFVIS